MHAFVIISYSGHYGWDTIIKCYNSIRNFDLNSKIIIINNCNENIHSHFINDNNLKYIINEENSHELGAIKKAVYNNDDNYNITNFFIIHDSCIINDTIPLFDKEKNYIFFRTSIKDIAPSLDIVKNWISKYYNNNIIYNDKDNIMCQGLMGYFKRDLLLKMFEDGLKNINVTCKEEAVASEGLFGILLKNYDNSILSYYDYKLNDYITNKVPWKFLIKNPGGKNASPVKFINNLLIINENDIYHPKYNFKFEFNNKIYESLYQCVVDNKDISVEYIILNYYLINKIALVELTNKRYSQYRIINDNLNLSEIYYKIHHRLFICRHFGTIE